MNHELARRTAQSLAVRSLRRTRGGLGALGDVSDFDWQATFNEGQNLVKTGQSYARAIDGLQKGVQAVIQEPTEQQQKQAFALLNMGLNAILPGAGFALDWLVSHYGASAGPGKCSTNPPKGPFDTSWPWYETYASKFGPYAAPAPGSFDALAYTLLTMNWELANNCYYEQAMPDYLVLASAVAAWNVAHAPNPKRTITRSGLYNWGPKDPIAFALMTASSAMAQAQGQCTGDPNAAFAGCVGPDTLSFTINDGPAIPQWLVTVLHGGNPFPGATLQPGPSASMTGMSTGAKVAVATGATAAAAAAGFSLYALAKGQALDAAWSSLWDRTGGRLFRGR